MVSVCFPQRQTRQFLHIMQFEPIPKVLPCQTPLSNYIMGLVYNTLLDLPVQIKHPYSITHGLVALRIGA